MTTIRIRKKVESETLILPELRALIGKDVEITVTEASAIPQVTPGTGDFAALPALAEEIRAEYDFDAFREQREYDLLHANDHLP
jgi:hypothetical protein